MILAIIVALVLGLALGSGGIWFVLRRRHAPDHSEAPEEDRAARLALAYGDRFQLFKQWQDVLERFQHRLDRAQTLDALTTALDETLHQVFASSGLVFAVGALPDLLLLDSLRAMSAKSIDTRQPVGVVVTPTPSATESAELVQDLFAAAARLRGQEHHWALISDLQPGLQTRLSQQYHFPGLSLIAPLFFQDIVCGILVIAGEPAGKTADVHSECGRFANLLSEMIMLWLRVTASTLLNGSADARSTAPAQVIDHLRLLESTTLATQVGGDDHAMIAELANFSRALTVPSAEYALLAAQASHTLRQVCGGDLAVVLRAVTNHGQTAYLAEAIDAAHWTWSRHRGFQSEDGANAELPISEDILANWPDTCIATAVETGQPVTLTTNEIHQHARVFLKLGMQALAALPATARDAEPCVLVVGRQSTVAFTKQNIALATILAHFTSIGFTNLRLAQQATTLREAAGNHWKEMSATTRQCLDVLMNVVRKRSVLSGTDPEAVATYSVAIAEQLNAPPRMLGHIRLSALLADIGTLMLPYNLMRKETGLTADELRLIRSHPILSCEMLAEMDIVHVLLPFIRAHHEHFDGNGYPDGLEGGQIPLEARIIAVADAFVHMQMERPYRSARTKAEALAIIEEASGKQFDPTVVRALLKIVRDQEQSPGAVA